MTPVLGGNMNNNELYHYGRKGMKWGQHIFGEKEKRSRSSFNTKNNGPVYLDKQGRFISVNGKSTDHKTQGVTALQNYKAKNAAYKEAREFMNTFKNVKANDVISLMGNKYTDEINKYIQQYEKKNIDELKLK